MMYTYNVLDYTNIVIGQLRAAADFYAWDQARQHFGHYYNVYISRIK